MATRQALIGLVLVVDARHGLGDLDLQLLDGFLPSGRPVLILATKMDKLTPTARRAAAGAIEDAVAAAHPPHAAQVTVIPFSATRRLGIEEAETLLGAWLDVTADRSLPRSRGTAARSCRQAKKRPRDQGECRGARNALRRERSATQGTRSGRKAGDVAVCSL